MSSTHTAFVVPRAGAGNEAGSEISCQAAGNVLAEIDGVL